MKPAFNIGEHVKVARDYSAGVSTCSKISGISQPVLQPVSPLILGSVPSTDSPVTRAVAALIIEETELVGDDG